MAKDNNFASGANYVNAVIEAGGIPVQIPVNPKEPAETLVSLVDGIIIPGGADVAPLSYGEQPHPKVTRTFRRNDIYESAMIHAAIQQGKPILAICRGIQILNVSLGGKLYQDIPSQTANEICHYQDSAARGEMTHSISVLQDSNLCNIVGKTEMYVNSYHIRLLGRSLMDSGLQRPRRMELLRRWKAKMEGFWACSGILNRSALFVKSMQRYLQTLLSGAGLIRSE